MLAIPILLSVSQLSTVAIDLPQDTPTATLQKVVESCNQALGGPRCQAATAGGTNASLHAVVWWEGTELRIRLLKGGPTGTEVDRREVVFSVEDAAQDRYIAAGLMVAALAAAQQGAQLDAAATPDPEEKPEPAPAVVPPSPPPPPIVELAAASAPLHLGADVGAHLGQGLAGHPLKWGGGVRLWWIADQPRFGATAQASYLGVDRPTTLRWSSASLGVIARLSPWPSRVGVEILGEAAAERAEARAETSGRTDTKALWRLGARLSSVVTLETAGWVNPFVGLQLTLLERGFDINLQGQPLGSEPRARLLGQLGFRITPP